MDDMLKHAGVVVFALVTAVTLLASMEQHAEEAIRFGAVAQVFDPVVAAGSFLLGVIVSLLFQWGIDVVHFEKILKLLPPKQQKVLEVLSTCKSATTEYLCYASRLPKATVSQVVSLLQAKNIINMFSSGNAILVESRIYLMHHASEAMRRLPGLTERRMIIALSMVLLFGMSFSVLNSYHIMVLRYPFQPTTYILSIEFICFGVAASLLARQIIATAHFGKVIHILPEDEQLILQQIFKAKSITQHELVLKTGMYKMKVSRILRKFQEKGLIDRISYGYTNLVVSKI